jgi:hypothetical protein
MRKPAIELQPQGIDDIAKGVIKGAKSAARLFNKPKSVTVNKIPPRTPPKSKQVIVPNEFGLPRVRQKLVISSKPKNYSETYMKGTSEYKDAIRAAKIKDKSLKDVNKYDAARKRRATEYNSARKAEAIVNKDKKKYGFVAAGPEADFVKKFIKMDPKKVRSGKR